MFIFLVLLISGLNNSSSVRAFKALDVGVTDVQRPMTYWKASNVVFAHREEAFKAFRSFPFGSPGRAEAEKKYELAKALHKKITEVPYHRFKMPRRLPKRASLQLLCHSHRTDYAIHYLVHFYEPRSVPMVQVRTYHVPCATRVGR